ncbi:MAG: hypothetical protein ABIY51_13790 [Ferruginibacter sp.]
MKRIFLSLALIATVSFSNAQKLSPAKVPAATKSAFAKAYPHTAGTWEKEDGNFEVNFKKAGKSMSAVITAKGAIKETESSIALGELPQAAHAYIAEHYKGKTIKDATKIVKADASLVYEARVGDTDLLFDGAGKFLQVEKD